MTLKAVACESFMIYTNVIHKHLLPAGLGSVEPNLRR